MRILLIRPLNKGNINTRLPESLNKRQGVLPPLGISYIAATLEKGGHFVKMLDVIVLNLSSDETREYIYEFKPDIVGITTMTSTLFGALEAAKIAKETGAITVLGGPQLSIYPQETLSYPYVDYGINGEGEFVMVELVNALEKKSSPDTINGLIYRRNKEIYVNEPAIVEDIDSLPFPAYHLLPMDKYSSIIGLYPISTMITSRGCPYHCSFCFKQPSDKKIRFRSTHQVVEEMEYLVKRYKVREIMFYDDAITSNRAHIVGICEQILSRNLGVKWEAPARVDSVDKELLELMHKSGCIRLRYGVESGDEGMLKLMNKRIDLGLVKEVLKLTKNSGIETFAYFMIGYLHETEITVKKTIDFALELNLDLVMFTVVTPYPGTPLYELVKKEGLMTTDYWREFTLGKTNSERIPYLFLDANRWVKKAYTKFYFRPNYIFRRLKKLRSWRDLSKSFEAFQGIFTLDSK